MPDRERGKESALARLDERTISHLWVIGWRGDLVADHGAEQVRRFVPF
jgi:hypothetical protein